MDLDHIGHHHIMFLGKGVISQKQNPFYISLPNIQAFESYNYPEYSEGSFLVAAWIRKKQTEVTLSKMFYMRAWISTYFLLSLPTDVRKIPAWNTTLIPKGITSSLKSEHSDSLTTTIRCTFTAKFWPVINTLQTPGELLVQKYLGKEMPNKHLSLTNIKTIIEKFECNMISSLTI